MASERHTRWNERVRARGGGLRRNEWCRSDERLMWSVGWGLWVRVGIHYTVVALLNLFILIYLVVQCSLSNCNYAHCAQGPRSGTRSASVARWPVCPETADALECE